MPKMEDKVMEPTEFECAVQQPDAEEDELEEMVKQARMKRVIAEIASSKIKPPEPKQILLQPTEDFIKLVKQLLSEKSKEDSPTN